MREAKAVPEVKPKKPPSLRVVKQDGVFVVPGSGLAFFQGHPALKGEVEAIRSDFVRTRIFARATSRNGVEYYVDVITGTMYAKATGECRSSDNLRLRLPVHPAGYRIPKRMVSKCGHTHLDHEGADE